MEPEAFDELWRHAKAFTLESLASKEEHCIYAQHYATWANALVQEEVKQPTHVGINQKMLLLTKRYFEWRAAVPKAHRERIGKRSQHVCLFHIFERVFYRLKVLELSLTPPMLFLPPPPPPPPAPAPAPPRPEIAVITLGELTGEEE